MDSTPKFASCSSCTDAGFGTALARHLGDCQIFDMYSNNILDLLGLTNLGTRCEDVVCKYEQVRELRFETAISFCILHFVSCIFSKFAGGKNRLFQTHSQSRTAILIRRYISNPRVHTSHGLLSTCLSNGWSRMIGDLCKFSPPRCILARTFLERALCVSKVYPY